MALYYYQAAIPPLTAHMRQLKHVLELGLAHAEANEFEPEILLQSRFTPDMFPLVRHVQIATDLAKACVARLLNQPPVSWEDNEKTFEELFARCDKAVTVLSDAKENDYADVGKDKIGFKLMGKEMNFPADVYLFRFVLPNVYFHSTTVYALLRHNGVKLGKMDYLGEF